MVKQKNEEGITAKRFAGGQGSARERQTLR